MSTDRIRIETSDGLGELIFNKPERRNALSSDMWEAIPALMRQLEDNPDVTAIIIHGGTAGAFAAGADISEFETIYATAESAKRSADLISDALASIAAWNDEAHVEANRALYREKFDAVLDILGGPLKVSAPAAGFYLWPKTPISDEEFAKRLQAEQNVTVLPGRYLSRTVGGKNPGQNRIRMALVAPLEECIEGAERIKALLDKL